MEGSVNDGSHVMKEYGEIAASVVVTKELFQEYLVTLDGEKLVDCYRTEREVGEAVLYRFLRWAAGDREGLPDYKGMLDLN